jgi:tetratricopeptide (TPR) repeat protein
MALTLSGKYAEAHSLLEESLAISTDLGDRVYADLYIPLYQSKVKIELGMYDQARAPARKALEVAREMRSWRNIGYALCVLGSIEMVEGTYTEARRLLQESIVAYRETGTWQELQSALACAGYTARELGQLAQARRHLCEALRIGTETGAFFPLITALPVTALLLADRGEPERAVELYALASRYLYVANSRWFEDVAGKHIAATAATLPPDVVVAAQERGQALGLDETVKKLLVELERQQGSDTL